MKGRQITAGPTLKLFEDKFLRIFEGEGQNVNTIVKSIDTPRLFGNFYNTSFSPVSVIRVILFVSQLSRRKNRKNVTGPPLLPPSPSKCHSTPGDSYGCFDKAFYLAPGKPDGGKKLNKNERQLPNCKIKPNPLGGPGYANICFTPFPQYLPSPYVPDDTDKNSNSILSRLLLIFSTKYDRTIVQTMHYFQSLYRQRHEFTEYITQFRI